MFEAFAGIGATCQAMKDLNLDFESVGISEIDKHAIKGYEAIHGPVNNYGDISKIEHLPDCDLLTYSYPCQSVSIAGRQEGMKEGSGTESALLWEVKRLLSDKRDSGGQLPEILLMENVDAVLNKKNYWEFEKWVLFLAELGYTSTYDVLNAKDYGTPQHRRRLFVVSTLSHGAFIFPPKCPDGRVLRDVLEDKVDPSFYLSEERLKTFIRHKERNDKKNNGFGFKIRDLDKPATAITTNPDRYCANWIAIPKEKQVIKAGRLNSGSNFKAATSIYDTDGVAPTLTCTHPGIGIYKILEKDRQGVKDPKIEVAGDLQIKGRYKLALRVYGDSGLSPCIAANQGGGLVPKIEDTDYSQLRIRYLTPRECLRLQDFPEEAINKLMSEITAKTNLYKLAGNSIPVCLLRAIFRGIYLDNSFIKSDRQITLNKWEE